MDYGSLFQLLARMGRGQGASDLGGGPSSGLGRPAMPPQSITDPQTGGLEPKMGGMMGGMGGGEMSDMMLRMNPQGQEVDWRGNVINKPRDMGQQSQYPGGVAALMQRLMGGGGMGMRDPMDQFNPQSPGAGGGQWGAPSNPWAGPAMTGAMGGGPPSPTGGPPPFWQPGAPPIQPWMPPGAPGSGGPGSGGGTTLGPGTSSGFGRPAMPPQQLGPGTSSGFGRPAMPPSGGLDLSPGGSPGGFNSSPGGAMMDWRMGLGGGRGMPRRRGGMTLAQLLSGGRGQVL